MANDRAYGETLCDALMKIFGAGHHDMEAIVAGLNGSTVPPPAGASWTAELLCQELRQRGPVPEKIVRAPFLNVDREPASNGAPVAPALPQATGVDERADYLVRHGLRNQWYCIAASQDVTAKPLAITRLNENLVVWRDAQDKVHALADRCPHRGVALSAGEGRDNVLVCAYHGLQIDGGGRIVKVPALSNCPLEGQRLVRSYPVVEHYQAVWAYFGDERHPEPPPLELPDELVSPDWSGMLHSDTWDGHYQYVYDNLCDPMHGPYLHGRTYTQQYGPKDDTIQVKRKDRGFEVFREGQRGVNFDWMEIVHTDSNYYARVEIPLPPTAGPGGVMGIIFYVTPIDDRHTRVNAWRLRRVSGWQRDLWHFLFEYRLRGFVDAVLAQDKRAMSAMPAWPAPENLYQHDIGLARMRRHIKDVARSQAQALFAETH